jgi:hypothetical protein
MIHGEVLALNYSFWKEKKLVKLPVHMQIVQTKEHNPATALTEKNLRTYHHKQGNSCKTKF